MKKVIIKFLFLVSLIPAVSFAAQNDGFRLTELGEALNEELISAGAGDMVKLENVRLSYEENGASFVLEEANFFKEKVGLELADDFKLKLDSLDFDRKTNRFGATIKIPQQTSNEPAKEKVIYVKGKYEVMTNIPVLVKRFYKGDIIKSSDIEIATISEKRLRSDSIRDAKDLIGKEVSRRLKAGRPVNQRDIARPLMVERGKNVKLVYRSPYMELRTEATSLDDGAVGDSIRVRNISSGNIVQAEVTPLGEAAVKISNNSMFSGKPVMTGAIRKTDNEG